MKWQVSAANLSCCPWGKATGKESSTKYQLEQSGKEGELQNQLSPSCGTAVSHWMAVHGKGVIWNSRDWKAGESFVIVTWRAMSLASGHSMENTCSSYKRITRRKHLSEAHGSVARHGKHVHTACCRCYPSAKTLNSKQKVTTASQLQRALPSNELLQKCSACVFTLVVWCVRSTRQTITLT